MNAEMAVFPCWKTMGFWGHLVPITHFFVGLFAWKINHNIWRFFSIYPQLEIRDNRFLALFTGRTYCGWKNSCTTLDGWNPMKSSKYCNGINHPSTVSPERPGLLRERHALIPGSLALEMAAFVRCGAARSALHLLWAAVPSSPGWQPGAGVASGASGLQWIRARGTDRCAEDQWFWTLWDLGIEEFLFLETKWRWDGKQQRWRILSNKRNRKNIKNGEFLQLVTPSPSASFRLGPVQCPTQLVTELHRPKSETMMCHLSFILYIFDEFLHRRTLGTSFFSKLTGDTNIGLSQT